MKEELMKLSRQELIKEFVENVYHSSKVNPLYTLKEKESNSLLVDTFSNLHKIICK